MFYFISFTVQGGQPSLFLQLVKIPLFIIVILSSPDEETPFNLGSLSVLSNTSLCISIFVSFAKNFLLLKLKIPSSK